MYRSFSVRRNRQSKPERPPGLIACQSATRYSRKHNKKGASPLPLRLTEVRPSTRMYRNRTWEHTPNGVYPQHLFPDIHLIGRFQLRANSSKYHFKTKIAKSAGFPKKRGAERQKSFSRGSSGAPQAALTEAGGGRCEGAVRGDAGRSAAAREGQVRSAGGADAECGGRSAGGNRECGNAGGDAGARRGRKSAAARGAGAGCRRMGREGTGPGRRLRRASPRGRESRSASAREGGGEEGRRRGSVGEAGASAKRGRRWGEGIGGAKAQT